MPAADADADAGLGNLDALTALQGADLAREACARVFAAVFDSLSDNGELPPANATTRAKARSESLRLLGEVAERIPAVQARPWAERITAELCGLGALSAPLAEPDVREIFVHGPERLLVRRGDHDGVPLDAGFTCPQAIEVVVRRLTGTWFGVESPVVDARTIDGAEVYAVHESVATGGPVVNITLPTQSEPRWSLEQLIAVGMISPVIANLLATCVQAGLNIAVCAAPGASAFPLLGALAESASPTERQVLVRPAREPGLLPASVVVLEGDGLVGTDGATVMQALVRTGLGLAPHRLLVHEMCGPEASEVFAAMGRGLAGTVVSTRGSTARAGLMRLATLVGLSGPATDTDTRARYVAQSIDLVLTVARFRDGRTRVIEIAEPILAHGVAEPVAIIGFDPHTAHWQHTGMVPTFFAELERRGYTVDAGMLA